MTKTVVGLMDTSQDAQNAIQELESNGFGRDSIRIMAEEAPSKGLRGKEELQKIEGTESGIGPVPGGAVGALKRHGMPEQDARNYAEGVQRGGILITVRCDDEDAERVAAILSRNGAIDMDERSLSWRKEEPSRFQEPLQEQARASTGREGVIPVIEEQVEVGKRQVVTGGVRVYSHVTERPVEEEVTLREERAKVERRPVDRPISEAEGAAFKEQSFEIRETAEEPVVSKQARVKEEVVVGKEASERTERVRETVRRTDVEVEKGGGFGGQRVTAEPTGTGEESEFLTHFSSNYATKGERFDTYRSAYHYAESRSTDPKFRDREWPDVEEDVHQDWEKTHPGTWARFKDAIHYGWNKTRRH